MICTIDISDVAVTVCSGERVLSSVPGFAIVRPRELLLGKDAEALRRLHPRQVVSGIWSHLSMQALPVTGFRANTWADLGFAQLGLAWDEARAADPAIEAAIVMVPPGFGRERLAVLLGVAEHCEFQVAGLVDGVVAALAAEPPSAMPALVVDVGQVSATASPVELDASDELRTSTPVEFAECGLLAMQHSWVAHIADQFVRETRYDPLHDAATEQQLYSQLPAWQAALRETPNVEVEVHNGSTRYRVVLDRATLLSADRDRWQPLLEHVRDSPAVILTDRAARTMGLAEALTAAGIASQTLDATASARGAVLHAERICRRPADGGYALIATLPVALRGNSTPVAAEPVAAPGPAASPPDTTATRGSDRMPTHVLVGARARPITTDILHIGRQAGDGRWAGTVGLPGHLCDIWRGDGHVCLRNRHAGGTRVNGVIVQGDHELNSGDVIEAIDTGVTLQAITVASD